MTLRKADSNRRWTQIHADLSFLMSLSVRICVYLRSFSLNCAENKGRVTWRVPIFFVESRCARSAIAGFFARPQQLPMTAGRRGNEWLGGRKTRNRATEIKKPKPVVSLFVKPAQCESLGTDHGAFNTAAVLSRENCIFPA